MALPQLTDDQRRAAQQKSLESRRARAELLANVKAGTMSVAEFVNRGQDEPVAGRTKVLQLVKALQGVGAVKAAQILADSDIAEDKRVQGLGVRQREALVRNALAA